MNISQNREDSNRVPFEAFREEWLQSVREGSPSTVELGHRFAHKLVTQWRDLDGASDDLIYCDGAGDGGVDIAFLDRAEGRSDAAETGDDGLATGDLWYLVQSKYGSAFRGTDTLLIEGQKIIETLDGRRSNLSSLASGLLERLTTFRHSMSEHDRIVLVYATEEPLNEAQRRTLSGVRAMGRERLGSGFEVEAVSIRIIYDQNEAQDESEAILLPLRADVTASGDELLVGAISLLDLWAFLKAYRTRTEDLDRLYEKNVRQFQGVRTKVNKKMLETLKETPERFGLYNNGITFVVESFERLEDGTINLLEPYIVNGCQTTRTIWEVFQQKLDAGGTGDNPELQAWRDKARQGVAVTKIVTVGRHGEGLLRDITRYTNSQNAVREKDFLTLTRDFKTWKKQMEDDGIYLEIQRGGWDSRRAPQKQNPKLPQLSKMANAFDLLKVYGASWLGEAGLAFGKNPPFLPEGSVFKRIMAVDGEESFDILDFYATYQLQEAADEFEFGRGGPVPRRQTRFMFYMVTIEVLKEAMTRANMETSPKSITRALIKLFAPGHESARDALLHVAVEIIDEYMTQGSEDSIFDEPAFGNTFNHNLNGYLKWDKLGKSENESPHLRGLLAVHKRTLGRASGGQASPRDQIIAAIKPESNTA